MQLNKSFILFALSLVTIVLFGIFGLNFLKTPTDKSPNQPIIVGSFKVSGFSGWHKTTYEDQRISNVKYARREEDFALTATFTFWKLEKGEVGITLDDLQTELTNWVEYEKSLGGSYSEFGITSRPTQFRTFPAIVTDIRKREGGRDLHSKYLHFIKDNCKYMIVVTVQGLKNSEKALQLQSTVWKAMISGLNEHNEDGNSLDSH